MNSKRKIPVKVRVKRSGKKTQHKHAKKKQTEDDQPEKISNLNCLFD